MLKRDQDRDDGLFILRYVDINAVFIVDRKHFLPYHCNDAAASVIELEVQAEDIAAQLPSEPLDVRYVLEQMEQFVGQFKSLPVGKGNKMALMDGKNFRSICAT